MHITHCPECATAFKVSPEQLRLAKGWVRCGRCNAVFEALQHLQPAAPAVAEPVTAAVPQASSTAPSTEAAWMTASSRGDDAADASAQAPAATPRRLPVWLMALTAIVLSLVLVWQVLLFQRDELASQAPALRPVLSALCVPTGCAVAWPKVPEALQIDSSSFTRDPDGSFRLQLRIKNSEHYAVASPSLELMLLDVREGVVLRRVFTPQTLAFDTSVAGVQDVSATLVFDLEDSLAAQVTGYRALLFYP